MTARELAEWLGVSLWTVRHWTRTGSGPPVTRLGPQSIRYDRRDVEAWLHDRKVTA